MKRKILIALFAVLLGLGGSVQSTAQDSGQLTSEQKDEINAFKKQNKTMLKQLKDQYDAKPSVMMTKDGAFYIVLEKRVNKVSKYLLADESGTLLLQDEIDYYKPTGTSYFFVSRFNGESAPYGVVSLKGELILPIEFEEITRIIPTEAGTFKLNGFEHWHPANEEVWMTYNKSKTNPVCRFYSTDGKTMLCEYMAIPERTYTYFWKLTPASHEAKSNDVGLLTNDGKVIYPMEYSRFYIESSGLVNCIKVEPDGLELYGGKMLDSNISDIEVKPAFRNVTYNTTRKEIMVQLHRDDSLQVYDHNATYTLSYRDQGERYYDQGKYQEVITFYEGEGYGAAWGDYFMGLSSERLAKVEVNKLDNVISTLKSSTNYYLPIKNPERYSFDAGTASLMYSNARTYLEKYLNNAGIPDDDPTKLKARKLRGEVVTASNSLTRKIEEYGTALSAATTKSIERDAAIARQQAADDAAADALASGLTKLLFGGAKKK